MYTADDITHRMEFKFPRPLFQTPETMAKMLATKRREAKARLPPVAKLTPNKMLCDNHEIPSHPSNEVQNNHQA